MAERQAGTARKGHSDGRTRRTKAVTAIECAQLEADYSEAGSKAKRLQIGGGLMLVADRKGGKYWLLRYTSPEVRGQDGKSVRRDMSLGPYSTTGGGLTLAKAREKAEELRDQIRKGLDPLAEKERATAAARAATAAAIARAAQEVVAAEEAKDRTLEAVATKYHEAIGPGFRNDKHRAQWLASLKLNVFPTLGATQINAVTVDQLLTLMLPLQDRVPETAKRVRERLAAVFDHAAMRGLCDRNPAALIRKEMQKRARAQGAGEHHRSMHYSDVPEFVKALRDSERSDPVVRYALEFLILTAARSGEVRGARRSEIDERKQTWTIPGSRMKAGKDHLVILSPRAWTLLKAVPLLKAVRDRGRGSKLIFPGLGSDPKQPLSDMTLLQMLRRMPTGRKRKDKEPETYGDLTTVHGFRAAFSSWAREHTRFRVEVIEASLAHKEKDRVAAAYSHQTEYLRERLELALRWEEFVNSADNPRADVIELGQTEANWIRQFRARNGGLSPTQYFAHESPVFAEGCKRLGISTQVEPLPTRPRKGRAK